TGRAAGGAPEKSERLRQAPAVQRLASPQPALDTKPEPLSALTPNPPGAPAAIPATVTRTAADRPRLIPLRMCPVNLRLAGFERGPLAGASAPTGSSSLFAEAAGFRSAIALRRATHSGAR